MNAFECEDIQILNLHQKYKKKRGKGRKSKFPALKSGVEEVIWKFEKKIRRHIDLDYNTDFLINFSNSNLYQQESL